MLRDNKELLEQIKSHQIILVTCDRAYESWSDNVLDLDRARSEGVATDQALRLAPGQKAQRRVDPSLHIEPQTSGMEPPAGLGDRMEDPQFIPVHLFPPPGPVR